MPIKRSSLTITIVGGGVYVASLLRALARFRDIPRLRIRLSARSHARLEVIARQARRSVAVDAPSWDIRAFGSTREAVSDADVVVLLARIGGGNARAHDETFPRAFGWVGDEGLGLGGLANAWRTFPVLESIGLDIGERSPRARVLNLMAPLPLTTRLLRELGLDAIGVCELPTTVERSLGSTSPLEYLGLNHLGWFWPALRSDASVLSHAVDRGLAHEETVESYGAIPLPYYYRVMRPDLGRSLGYTAPVGRAQELSRLSERIFGRMARGSERDIPELQLRKTPWFDDALVPVLRSLFLGTEHRGFANAGIPNGRRVLRAGTVLECRAVFAGFDITLEPPRHVPKRVSAFLERMASVADRAYQACRNRDRSVLAFAVSALGGVPDDRVADAVHEVCRPVSPALAGSWARGAWGS